jgi:peroxiredoxin
MRLAAFLRQLPTVLGFVIVLVGNATSRAAEVPNFALLDDQGRGHELHRADGRAVVLFFTGIGCPVARKSAGKLLELRRQFANDVTVWLVDSELGVDPAAVGKEAAELGLSGALPVLLDSKQALAQSFGVERTAETIVLDTKTWSIVYRGALDDQLTEGAEKPAPTVRYAERALAALLKGEAIPDAQTAAKGCLLTFASGSQPEKSVDYAHDVAPILQRHCVMCHRSGDIGPFAFSSYETAKRKARMIEEVILTQRMPPWHADPHFGKFANAAELNAAETQTLLRWIQQGAPPSADSADPLAQAAPETAEWPLGKPDYIIKLPHPEEVPATGVLGYRHIKMSSPVPQDAWIGAAVVKPGNRKVLHHAILFARFQGSGNGIEGRGVKIAGWAPGRMPGRLPEGTGIFLGKGAELEIELHYTTNGTPQTDDTEIGLYLLPEKPRLVYKTGMAIKLDFNIPPNDPEAEAAATFKLAKDSIIYVLTPHMHMRGSWMRYEAQYPDGRTETLLSVPRFDFNWQTSYVLAKPLHVPAGTKIVCQGAFDNSAKNPSNPDATKTVRWGQQSWDEMFIGYVGYAEVPTAPASASASTAAVR